MLHHNSRFLKTTAAAATAAQSADRYSGNSNLILRPELVKEDNRENSRENSQKDSTGDIKEGSKEDSREDSKEDRR